MVNFNTAFTSPLYSEVDSGFTKNLDINKTVKSFWDEMTQLMNDFAYYSLNPNADESFYVGDKQVAGDMAASPAVSLLIENRLAQIEQAQAGLLNILDMEKKLEDQLNAKAV